MSKYATGGFVPKGSVVITEGGREVVLRGGRVNCEYIRPEIGTYERTAVTKRFIFGYPTGHEYLVTIYDDQTAELAERSNGRSWGAPRPLIGTDHDEERQDTQ